MAYMFTYVFLLKIHYKSYFSIDVTTDSCQALILFFTGQETFCQFALLEASFSFSSPSETPSKSHNALLNGLRESEVFLWLHVLLFLWLSVFFLVPLAVFHAFHIITQLFVLWYHLCFHGYDFFACSEHIFPYLSTLMFYRNFCSLRSSSY